METYRDSVEALVRRRDELRSERAGELRRAVGAPRVYRSRVARIAFGATMIAFAAAMVAAVVIPYVLGGKLLDDGVPAMFLLASWPAAIFIACAARMVAMSRRSGRAPSLPFGDDVRVEIRALETLSVEDEVCGPARRLEGWSVALPLIGLALMAPLTIHFVAAETIWGAITLSRYEGWLAVSLAIVGHAHLAIVVVAILFAQSLRTTPTDDIAKFARSRGFWAYGVAVGCSFLPGVIFAAIPTVIAAVTGILFVPWMFILIGRWIVSERVAMTVEPLVRDAGATAFAPPISPSAVDAAPEAVVG